MRSLRSFLITIMLLIAACGTVATPQPPSEEAQAVQPTALPATLPPTLEAPTQIQPTPTLIMPTLTPAQAEPTQAAQPTPMSTQAEEVQPTEAHEEHTSSSTDVSAIGDPANGQELFNTIQSEVGFACATCHRVDSDQRLVGPSLMGVSEHAVQHNTGQNAVQYIYTSITDPGAYVVEGFIDRLMPRTYSQIFTPDEINDLIAYLLTL